MNITCTKCGSENAYPDTRICSSCKTKSDRYWAHKRFRAAEAETEHIRLASTHRGYRKHKKEKAQCSG